MKRAIALLALLLATPAFAQAAPYKLIIRWYQSSLTVIDYPTKARCEAARQAVMAEIARLQAETDAQFPGSRPIGPGFNGAFCIPG